MPETVHQLALPLETHRNHYLFSDHYLNELLPRQAVWREAEAEARDHLKAMGFGDVDDIDIEDCGDYYRIRIGGREGCCPGGDPGTLLGTPRTESKTLGEIKGQFTE